MINRMLKPLRLRLSRLPAAERTFWQQQLAQHMADGFGLSLVPEQQDDSFVPPVELADDGFDVAKMQNIFETGSAGQTDDLRHG